MLGSSVSWSHHRTVGHQQLPDHLKPAAGVSQPRWLALDLETAAASPFLWVMCPPCKLILVCHFWKPRHLRELEGSNGSVGGQAGSTGGFSRAVSHWMGVRKSVPVDQVPRVSITKYHRLSG